MFDSAFWMSFAYELLVPLILTSTLFWVIILPKAQELTLVVVKELAQSLTIPPCNALLQWNLSQIIELRRGLSQLKKPNLRSYILAMNIFLIALLILISILIPLAYRVPRIDAIKAFLEILGMYAIVGVAEIFFIKEVAFKYVPGNESQLRKEMVARFATACFDQPLTGVLPSVPCTTLSKR